MKIFSILYLFASTLIPNTTSWIANRLPETFHTQTRPLEMSIQNSKRDPIPSQPKKHQLFKQWLNQPKPENGFQPQITRIDLPVLVVGAGPAGLATMNVLKKAQIQFEGVESHTQVGGLWDQTNPESVAYDDLMTNSSGETTRIDPELPFPHHSQAARADAAEYLQKTAQTEGLLDSITFGRTVKEVEKTPTGSWIATLTDLRSNETVQKEYRAILVAAGVHRKQNAVYPEDLRKQLIENQIDYIHSAQYRNKNDFSGKTVLVIGAGNSAIDISTEIAEVAEKVFLSIRTTPYLVPLNAFGIPSDKFVQSIPTWVPVPVKREALHFVQRLHIGNPVDLGFAPPTHNFLDRAPAFDRNRIKRLLRENKIILRPAVSSVQGSQVYFSDPNSDPQTIDSVLFATGYARRYSFIPKKYADFENSEFKLTFQVFHKTEPGLIFLSDVSVPQSNWPMFRAEALAAAAYLKAEEINPAKAEQFNRLRASGTEISFKNGFFLKDDEFTVDPNVFTSFLREFSEWMRRSD